MAKKQCEGLVTFETLHWSEWWDNMTWPTVLTMLLICWTLLTKLTFVTSYTICETCDFWDTCYNSDNWHWTAFASQIFLDIPSNSCWICCNVTCDDMFTICLVKKKPVAGPKRCKELKCSNLRLHLRKKSTYITLEDTFLQVSRMDLFVTGRFKAISVREIRARTIPVGRIALPDRPHLWDEQCAGALKWLDLSLLYQWTSRQKLAPKTKPSSSLQPCVL